MLLCLANVLIRFPGETFYTLRASTVSQQRVTKMQLYTDDNSLVSILRDTFC